MKDDLRFSDLGKAYSNNLYNLSEARKVFEEECRVLNSKVALLINEHARSHNQDRSKFLTKVLTWGKPGSSATEKDGNWLSYFQQNYVDLNLKIPNRKIFEKNVAFLAFDICYDSTLRRFVFQVIFENKYAKNPLIDEKVFELASKSPADFPNAKHVKGSTCVIGFWELDNHLTENVNDIITRSMKLTENAFIELYPEGSYSKAQIESNTEEDEVA